MKPLLAILIAAALAGASPMAHSIEEPKHTVVRKFDDFELREYAPQVVAEVLVPGPADEAGNRGFRLLAGYIFGRNKGEKRISMTAPVTQSAEPAKIRMTAPVSQAEAEGGYVVRFTMPSEYTLDRLPEPIDPEVKLREIPAARFAVIRYSGTWSESNYREHLEKLQRGVEAAGLRVTGAPVWSRYDPPWTPWFMRRNEIWLPVE